MRKRINITIDENVLEKVTDLKERTNGNLSFTIELLVCYALKNLKNFDNDYELLAHLLILRKEIP